MNLTALWVLGHECGHGGFSDHRWLNDAVGLASHTFCGTPYYAWAASHAKHHRHTNDMDGGESWVPDVLPAGAPKGPLFRFYQTRLGAAARGLAIFGVGFHMYLLTNVTSEKANAGVTHYAARTPLFNPAKHSVKFALNNALLLGWYGYVASLVRTHFFPHLKK
jgi:omega-6 fatty acid desaturase (delta-12 desaturase)